MIGRHFLIYSEDMIKIKRQYTICNSIIPHIYKQLIKLCEDLGQPSQSKGVTFENTLLDSTDKDSFYVTCKNYKTETGVSNRLNLPLEKQPYWFAKGPMGMGLSVD